MKVTCAAAFFTLFAQANAQAPLVANYQFITDFSNSYLRADGDVKFISKYVDVVNQIGFDNAKAVYQQGSHFGSQVIVNTPPTTVGLASRELVTGQKQAGGALNLTSGTTYAIGSTNLTFVYAKSSDCVVGALQPADQTTSGCLLAPTGTIVTNTSANIPYTISLGNSARRSVQAFAGTNTSMRGRDGQFFPDFQVFLDYYGAIDYAHGYVLAALDGTPTTFTNGNVDFTGKPPNGRHQSVKKAVPYMIYYMHAIRYFNLGQQLCSIGAFEEGVALFIGSLEGPTGTNGSGFMPYTLGDKRCPNFKTCGTSGNELTGIAKVNLRIIEQFNLFKATYNTSNCTTHSPTLLPIVTNIANLMKIPAVQATLRYAELISTTTGEVPYAVRTEGGAFAAGVIPYVHKCDPVAAKTIYDKIWTGTGLSAFTDVKAAFEKNYACMGITCADVGGIVGLDGQYKNNTKPCTGAVAPTPVGSPQAPAPVKAPQAPVNPPTACLAAGSRCTRATSSRCCSRRCRFFFRRCT